MAKDTKVAQFAGLPALARISQQVCILCIPCKRCCSTLTAFIYNGLMKDMSLKMLPTIMARCPFKAEQIVTCRQKLQTAIARCHCWPCTEFCCWAELHHVAPMLTSLESVLRAKVGSNNVNLLFPAGQFGTRIQGGRVLSFARLS